jgi:uncharacterized protein YigE (DUF2233 family)
VHQVCSTFARASIAILLLTIGAACGSKSTPQNSQLHIVEVNTANHSFAICNIFLNQAQVDIEWKRTDGTRLGTFDNLNSLVSRSGRHLLFATNAGIFDPTFAPCGLLVQDGRELSPLNLKDGQGNFYMKPNGVFLIDDHGAAIIDSAAYAMRSTPPRLATQSGPLLVIDRAINAQFKPDSTNRRIRSGVGVVSPNHIIFVLSRDRVTFLEFASFFREQLNCRNALYLDGEISRFYPDANHPSDRAEDFAAMFAVTARN